MCTIIIDSYNNIMIYIFACTILLLKFESHIIIRVCKVLRIIISLLKFSTNSIIVIMLIIIYSPIKNFISIVIIMY